MPKSKEKKTLGAKDNIFVLASKKFCSLTKVENKNKFSDETVEINDSTELSKEDLCNEEFEISRKSKVEIPFFKKRTSPFKHEHKSDSSKSFLSSKSQSRSRVDYK